jgi:hypothetical protein
MKLDFIDGISKLLGEKPASGKQKDVKPYKYLLDKIGNREVRVFVDTSPEVGFGNPAFNSFKESTA